jgi:hypothetical protein
MVVSVSHDDVAVPVHCNPHGMVELRNGTISVSMAFAPIAYQSGHTTLWCDLANTMVLAVSHDEVTVLTSLSTANSQGSLNKASVPFPSR